MRGETRIQLVIHQVLKQRRQGLQQLRALTHGKDMARGVTSPGLRFLRVVHQHGQSFGVHHADWGLAATEMRR